MADVLADRLRVRPTERPFQLLPLTLLLPGHPPLAPQLAVGVEEPETSVGLDRHVMVDRVVLAVFEALEAVEDHRTLGWGLLPDLHVQQHAVTGEPGDVAVDGLGTAAEIPTHLAGTHAPDQAHEDPALDVGALEPVGGGECLRGETPATCPAYRTRDTSTVTGADIGATAMEGPRAAEMIVVLAVTVGAVGRRPTVRRSIGTHDPGSLRIRGHEQSSRQNLIGTITPRAVRRPHGARRSAPARSRLPSAPPVSCSCPTPRPGRSPSA